MRLFTAGLTLVLALAACGRASETDPATIRQTIDEHNASFERWYAAGHVDSIGSAFAEDAWQMPPNAPALVGRDSIMAFWRNASGWGRWEFDLEAQDVQANDRLAVERGRFTLKFTPGPQAPMPAFEDRGNYLVLWRLEPDGEWRIVWDAPVSELPLPGAPAQDSVP